MKHFMRIVASAVALCLLLAVAAGCSAKKDTPKQEMPTEPAVVETDAPAGDVAVIVNTSLTLSGIVSETGKDYFIMNADDNAQYHVNYGETTLCNVALSDIVVGAKLTVTYDGKETRSVPPQLFADAIDVCSVFGTVSEITEEGFVLVVSDNLSYEVLPMPDSLPEALPALESGMSVTVIYDGKETRSIPAQITGYKVVVPMISGIIDSIEGNALTVTDEATGSKVIVTVADAAAFEAGKRVHAVYNGAMTLSLPPQVNATHVYIDE